MIEDVANITLAETLLSYKDKTGRVITYMCRYPNTCHLHVHQEAVCKIYTLAITDFGILFGRSNGVSEILHSMSYCMMANVKLLLREINL